MYRGELPYGTYVSYYEESEEDYWDSYHKPTGSRFEITEGRKWRRQHSSQLDAARICRSSWGAMGWGYRLAFCEPGKRAEVMRHRYSKAPRGGETSRG